MIVVKHSERLGQHSAGRSPEDCCPSGGGRSPRRPGFIRAQGGRRREHPRPRSEAKQGLGGAPKSHPKGAKRLAPDDAATTITVYDTEHDEGYDPIAVKLTIHPDATIVFKGLTVPHQDYETIPWEFRYALDVAFPWLITPPVGAEFEPDELPVAEEVKVTGKRMQGVLSFEPAEALIPVDTSTGEPRTDARALHASLGSKRQFGNWFDQRTQECDLVKDQDFGVLNNFVKNPQGGRPTIDYWLTLDAAKHMAMLERNEQGRKIRQYLIDVEKRFRAQQQPASQQLTMTELCQASAPSPAKVDTPGC